MAYITDASTTPIAYANLTGEPPQPATEDICEHCQDTRYTHSKYIGAPLGDTHDSQRTSTTHIALWLCAACMTDGDKERVVLLPDHANFRAMTNEELLERAV